MNMRGSEIAELMSVKSKHGAGGEYSPEWRPKVRLCTLRRPTGKLANIALQPDVEALPDAGPPPPAIEAPGPARPAWRVVHKRAPRKEKALMGKEPPPPAPAPIEAPRPDLPAWAQWRRTGSPFYHWGHLY